ncbi:MAG: alpha/beta fold hydrolase [Proteobacteria bacterium]|nr:alpha/beta fold hydrolase [Pseudomonadota bacterium]
MSRPQHLILIPGLLLDEALWRHQTAYLKDTVQVTVADVTKDDAIPAMAERILADAPPSFALAGLSLGGYVAQEIMRQAPERVERLALVATNARADNEEQQKNRTSLIKLADIGKFKGVTPRLLPSFVHPDRLNDPSVAGVVMEMAERVGQEAFVRQQRAIMARKDGRSDLEAIRIPTLILAGRQDLLCPPKVQEEMAARLTNARLVFIEDCGHLPPLERPHATTAVLRYWLG